jgi:hypothetical protein
MKYHYRFTDIEWDAPDRLLKVAGGHLPESFEISLDEPIDEDNAADVLSDALEWCVISATYEVMDNRL